MIFIEKCFYKILMKKLVGWCFNEDSIYYIKYMNIYVFLFCKIM